MPYWITSFADTSVKGRDLAERGAETIQRVEPSYVQGGNPRAHLEFALRYEGINLEGLALLFPKMGPDVVASWLKESPTSKYARRAGFLYEFLTGATLPVDDLQQGNYVPLLEPDEYFVAAPIREKRFRVDNNLPGTKAFCPLVRRTKLLAEIESRDLKAEVAKDLSQYDADLLTRAANYLYIKETQSSYEIEREKPSQNRIQRFADLLRKQSDDKQPLTEDFFVGLQNQIIDERFREGAYRGRQNWIGESATYRLPDFIPPRPDDVPDLMEGLAQYANRHLGKPEAIEPIALTAAISFGFVFIHPFMDGNGRMHRFLIHKILSSQEFTPKGFVLPVSAVMLANLQEYGQALAAFSKVVMSRTNFSLDTPDIPANGNDAIHFRYFDATRQAEFLAKALVRTVEHDLEKEIRFLIAYDKAAKELNDVFDWPKGDLSLFIGMLHQNKGKLSKRKKDSKFAYLKDEEIQKFEEIFAEAFDAMFKNEQQKRNRPG